MYASITGGNCVPTRQVTESKKPSRKKRGQVTTLRPLPFPDGMIHRSWAALPRVANTLRRQGSDDNPEPFATCVAFQISGTDTKKERKKKKRFGTNMHLILQHNVTQDWGGKTIKRKQKSDFQCIALYVCVFWLCAAGRGRSRPKLSFFFFFKTRIVFYKVALRLPRRRAARIAAQRTRLYLFPFLERRTDGLTDRQSELGFNRRIFWPSFRPALPRASSNLWVDSSRRL